MISASASTVACVGVIGAGTMGAGIAQLAAAAGARTLLYDPDSQALASATDAVALRIGRLAEKGRISRPEAEEAVSRLETLDTLGGLEPADIVIEAAPESIEIKRELLGRITAIVSADCVIATNTSSISISELGAGTAGSERVIGMHFFNPAPLMKLVEIVAGEASGERALETARSLGRAMGKLVVDAPDVPGFLVNRCNRPYSLESLKILEERLAAVDQIDRIARSVGGFRMGPFELMDLIGIDTNHAIAEVMNRASFGEPRYRPSPLAATKIAAGRLGRKSGRGWYDYSEGPDGQPSADPDPAAAGGGEGRLLLIRGLLPAAGELRKLATGAGWAIESGRADEEPWLTVDFGDFPGATDGPRLRHLHDGSLHRLDPQAAGFHLVPPLAGSTAIEFTRTRLTDPVADARTQELLRSLGRVPEPVEDAPGLILGRIVCQLINESAFFVGEGRGRAADIDTALELAVSHPRGPMAWSRCLGLFHVVSLLDALSLEPGGDRYRVAPPLRQCLAVGDDLG